MNQSLPAALLLAIVAACSGPLTAEQQIIAVIRNMEASVEERERRPFMQRVSPEFHGQGGSLDYDRLNAYLVLQLRRNEGISARLSPITVEVDDAYAASARFNVLLTGGSGLLPERGRLLAVTTHWRREEGEWLLIAATWSDLLLE